MQFTNGQKNWIDIPLSQIAKEPISIWKKFLTLLITRAIKVKTTIKYHSTLNRMAMMEKVVDIKCRWECGEIGTLIYCWQEFEMLQPLWKIVWQFLIV